MDGYTTEQIKAALDIYKTASGKRFVPVFIWSRVCEGFDSGKYSLVNGTLSENQAVVDAAIASENLNEQQKGRGGRDHEDNV